MKVPLAAKLLLAVTVAEAATVRDWKVSVPEFAIDEPLLKVIVPPLGVKTPDAPTVKTPPTVAVFVPVAMAFELIFRFPYVRSVSTCPVPVYSTVRLVSVLFVIVYWLAKSAVALVLVTCTVPDPVRVPEPLMTVAAAGVRIVADPFILKVAPTPMFVLTERAADVFESVRLLKLRDYLKERIANEIPKIKFNGDVY